MKDGPNKGLIVVLVVVLVAAVVFAWKMMGNNQTGPGSYEKPVIQETPTEGRSTPVPPTPGVGTMGNR